jgi:hypothetical protein
VTSGRRPGSGPSLETLYKDTRVASMADPAFLTRLHVLIVFALAPLFPGYRGVRIPLGALAGALFPRR